MTHQIKKKNVLFHKDMTLTQVLDTNPNTRAVLMGFGMHCFGCPVSQLETLEQAAMVHGIELDYLLKKLNEVPASDKSEMGANPFPWDDEF